MTRISKIKWCSIGEWDQPVLFTCIEAGYPHSKSGKLLTPKLADGYRVTSRHFYFEALAQKQIKKFLKGAGFLKKYINQQDIYLKSYRKFIKKNQDPKIKNRKEALKLFKIFISQSREIAYFMITGLILDKLLMQQLKNKVDTPTLSEITKPEKIFDVTKEIKNLRKLKLQIYKEVKNPYVFENTGRLIKILQDKHPKIIKALEKHLKEYAYLPMQTFRGKPWEIEDLIIRIHSLPPLPPQNTTSPSIKLDQQTTELVKYFKYLNEFRTLRIELINKCIWKLNPLWQHIAKYLNIKPHDLKNLSEQEIVSCLASGKPYESKKHELRGRNSAYSFLYKNGITKIKSVPLVISSNSTRINIQKVSGMTGNKGKAIGKVRIIRGVDEFKKFKPGEILITSQTTPNFVSIMAQSKAIVTDMGGITSHAAIVSRELGIPCVIGTKIATKVFKDGDTVEVDANNGIVKLIK